MVDKQKPAAFMSYARSDDDRFRRLTQFREDLSAEVQRQIGEEFPIFQDREDIRWGQNWKKRIEESIDEVTFLIPIITPSFFKSSACRDELHRFIEREKKLGRNDLILPVYYVDSLLLNDEEKRAGDDLAQVIAARQRADWRDLRHESFTSSQVGKTLEKLAVQIRDVLEHVQASEKIDVPESAASITRRPAEDMPVPLPPDIESMIESREITRRPTAKTEPPIRVVDQMHRGEHVTITEAIEAANPGDRILVRPGLYNGGLVIDKPLEIIGDGAPGEVVVEARGKDVLLFRTTMGKVVNLTLRQMGGGDWDCVNIAQGRLELEDCDITSQSSTCVTIHGGADPRLRCNRIHDGKMGVFVFDGRGVLEDNDIFGNASAGVAIVSGGNPTLRRNRIHDGKVGVFVSDNGQGVLEDNDIFGNTDVGMMIGGGGNPMVRRNRIHDGKENGVFVVDNGQGVLEDNDIFGNTFSGVVIMKGGNPTLRHNRIHDGEIGVGVYENGQGILEDNDIFGNAVNEVTIRECGDPTLRHNRIHNGEVGVFVYENGQGMLEYNDIFGNAVNEVAIMEGGNPTLRRNRIHNGKRNGVIVYKNGQGILEDNDIFGNAHSGIEIREGGNPTVRRNHINKNGGWAVSVTNGGGGTIEDNDLRGNAKGAWNISPDSDPNLRRARNKE